jgi:hypothetical protein
MSRQKQKLFQFSFFADRTSNPTERPEALFLLAFFADIQFRNPYKQD